MEKWPKPVVIFTHESDLDGFLSSLLLQKLAESWFEETIPIEAYQNDAWQKRTLTEKAAWVSDFAFDSRMDRPNWVVIDHHPTGTTPRNARLIHHTRECSCSLVYQVCQQAGLANPVLDRLVALCRLADLFEQDHADFTVANDYANLVKTYQFWNLCTLIEGNPERLLNHPLLEVMAVKRRVEDPLGLEWSRKNIVQLSPAVGFVEVLLGSANLIVNQLLKERACPHTVLLSMFRRGNGTIVVSLRSLNGEALKIAELLHGGGHPNACGAVLPRSVQSIPDAIAYLRKILNPTSVLASSAPDLDDILDELKPGSS
ncbi:MAG TPA: DHH family phosphoesterase [Candidatus Paceibacterota bacterium]|nr:DHH family phosphoesterase [Candidatus Paceibacterota bacterium]HSA03828.1 DHH family phosphoesterase [Candidatus Paceibacterota bacterium]